MIINIIVNTVNDCLLHHLEENLKLNNQSPDRDLRPISNGSAQSKHRSQAVTVQPELLPRVSRPPAYPTHLFKHAPIFQKANEDEANSDIWSRK